MQFCASLIALSEIKLRKLSASYDPTDRIGAQDQIAQAAVKGEVLTGLLYLAPHAEDLHAHLNTVATPFNKLAEEDLCPARGCSRRSTPLCDKASGAARIALQRRSS